MASHVRKRFEAHSKLAQSQARSHDTPAISRCLITPREAADIIGCGLTKLYGLLSAGQLRAVKLGRLTRIRPEDLEEWLAQLPVRVTAA